MVESLLIINEEGRRFFIGEGRQPRKLPALTAQFNMLTHHIRRPDTGFQFFEKGFTETHNLRLTRNYLARESAQQIDRANQRREPEIRRRG